MKVFKLMNKYPKRLIEVDLPIKRISAHSRRDKDMRCGHIPRLHIYPAARPTVACRAIACAALWPDPADELCPQPFIDKAHELMLGWAKDHLAETVCQESQNRFVKYQSNPEKLDDLVELRMALLDFIADFSAWESSTNKAYLETARALTQSAHEALGGEPGTRPLVVDPFAGGGAIPLEALRIGADAFATDVNPLAILIQKVILQYIPQYGSRLADAVHEWLDFVKKHADPALRNYYPLDEDGLTPIAYLWARTILSEAPTEDQIPVEIPLIRSMWLQRKGDKVALRWVRDKQGKVRFDVVNVTYSDGTTCTVKRPRLEIFTPSMSSNVEKGTVSRSSATCPITGYTVPANQVRSQLSSRYGGADDARMYCVVSISGERTGRRYRIPVTNDYAARDRARKFLPKLENRAFGTSAVPDEILPVMSGVFNAPLYGHNTWGSLFNSRQLVALDTYSRLVEKFCSSLQDEDEQFVNAVATVIALVVDRLVDLNAALCVWQLSTPNTAHVFGRWALPMVMDYGEVNPIAGAGGSPESAMWRVEAVINELAKASYESGNVQFASAANHPLPDDSAQLLFTDPPYYNAIPYADISDFFYVWLRRTLGLRHKEILSESLIPKDAEICEMAGWDPIRYSHKDKGFFENGMTAAMSCGRMYIQPSGVGVVVFAHKTTSGWEAMLQALIEAGWIITASWPIDTEMGSRLRAKNSAALASSIHIVCRPRENEDGSLQTDNIGDWREVLGELPGRIKEWMVRLSKEGVVGADAIFACLGPALEIFSRYSRVEKADGEQVTLSEYLEQIWASVSNEALKQVFKGASTSGFEEDARLTAMWLWTLGGSNGNGQEEGKTVSSGGYTLEFDAARKIAQGLGAHLEQLSNLIEISGDKARLLPVNERAEYLFGKDKNLDMPKGKKKKKEPTLFDHLEDFIEEDGSIKINGHKVEKLSAGLTTLDRIHQAMLLFAAGRSEAVRRFLVDEGVGADSRFWTLAQAMSALYPSSTEEKRWVDGILARKKGLGF